LAEALQAPAKPPSDQVGGDSGKREGENRRDRQHHGAGYAPSCERSAEQVRNVAWESRLLANSDGRNRSIRAVVDDRICAEGRSIALLPGKPGRVAFAAQRPRCDLRPARLVQEWERAAGRESAAVGRGNDRAVRS